MDPEYVEMGNDEFILYIRKNYPECQTDNQVLGRQIFQWLRDNANATEIPEKYDKPCYWGTEGDFISSKKLPYQASAFRFLREQLPNLYLILDRLGAGY